MYLNRIFTRVLFSFYTGESLKVPNHELSPNDGNTMNPAELVLAIVSNLPGQAVKGKKRLQKLAFLLKEAGLRCNVRFEIRDYGPFSREVASAANLLAAIGKISEIEEPVGASHTFVTVYRIVSRSNDQAQLADKYKKILARLEAFSSIELEVAATVQFYRSVGLSDASAKQRTIELKPTKATPNVLKSVPKVLSSLAAPG
ncbi:MAG: hypothetical protein QOF19_73 [Alphaproteobacteria bacterium]|nr:hypothetical protein [Alphaproteobacteria bacterium]